MGFLVVQVGNLSRKQNFLEKKKTHNTALNKHFIFTEILPN